MPTKRKMVHVYVTPEEKELIEDKAKRSNMSVSKWLLYLALNSHVAYDSKSGPASSQNSETQDAKIPPPPSDGIQRGPQAHPSKASSGEGAG